MLERLDEAFIPEDTAAYWAAMAAPHGGWKLHRSLYQNMPAALRSRIMLDLCRATDKKSCVEPGCGAGLLTIGLAEIFEEVDAFDGCEAMVSEAPPMDNVSYFVADADVWQPMRRYSVGFLSEIIEHVRNPVEMVDRYAAVCDTLIVSAPVNEPLANEHAFDVAIRKHPVLRSDGSGHIWAWDFDGFMALFSAWPCRFWGNLAEHGIVMVDTSGEAA